MRVPNANLLKHVPTYKKGEWVPQFSHQIHKALHPHRELNHQGSKPHSCIQNNATRDRIKVLNSATDVLLRIKHDFGVIPSRYKFHKCQSACASVPQHLARTSCVWCNLAIVKSHAMISIDLVSDVQPQAANVSKALHHVQAIRGSAAVPSHWSALWVL